jgi:ribonucleoside-triphosphate reductase
VVNFFYTLQGEAAGAQAFSNFDTLLAPFIRFDRLAYAEVRQALQEFIFNINVPTRVGFQTPFTNVTLDVTIPRYYAGQNVIVGGQPKKETYGEFQEEMNLFNRAFLEVMAAGDAKGRVFTFPIPTYNITRDFNWDDPNLEGLWEMTAKYGVPYFSNFINSDMNPEDARSMCCRLRIDNRELEKRGGGLFGSNPLTGSIGVVTINMPRIGYLAETEEAFMVRLEKLMFTAKESLETKRKVLENFTEKNLYPYTKYYLRDVKRRFGEYWKNHFATIGLVGMNEACLNLLGRHIGAPEGQAFTRKVMDFMRNKLIEYQQETGNNYNLESTPAEGTSYRLARMDRGKYPDIICANEQQVRERGAEPYYTNSTQLPVNFTDDVFEALDLQDPIQTKYTGGTVFHTFIGERIADPAAVKRLVQRICANYHLPYLTFTPTFSVCPSHGYLSGEQETCPTCRESCEVYSRVVGYLRPVKQWNKGKQEEFAARKAYRV